MDGLTPFVEMNMLINNGVEMAVPDGHMVLTNSRYQVVMRLVPDAEPFGRLLWLSIKRLDKQPIRDWRDLQRIKNEIVSPQAEAVEIYPAESRLVDTSNQFHLFVFLDYYLPFGFAERMIIEHPELDPRSARAVQRPWEEGQRPADVKHPSEVLDTQLFTRPDICRRCGK